MPTWLLYQVHHLGLVLAKRTRDVHSAMAIMAQCRSIKLTDYQRLAMNALVSDTCLKARQTHQGLQYARKAMRLIPAALQEYQTSVHRANLSQFIIPYLRVYDGAFTKSGHPKDASRARHLIDKLSAHIPKSGETP
jgi:hypothetical protein